MAGRAARALALVCLAGCFAGGLVSGAAASKRAVPHDFFAVGGGWMNKLAFDGNQSALDAHAKRMAAFGIESARISADWQTAEYAPPVLGVHDFNFTILDRAVRALAKYRVRAAPFLIGSPTWARDATGPYCGYRTTPPNGGFAAFAQAVVERYGRNGTFWSENPGLPYVPVHQYEVWNEENWLGYWCPELSPARYASLLLATARAIHGVDPDARVIAGGLVGLREDKYDPNLLLHGMQPVKFVSQMLSAAPGLRGELGGIGYHSYALWPAENLDLLRFFRQGLRTLSLDSTPIIFNEFGWPSHGRDARTSPENVRSIFISKLATWIARSNCGVTQIAPHTWATAEQDPSNAEDWFGLVDPLTARPHPAARAYSSVALRFEGRLRKKRPPRTKLAVCSP